MPPYPAKSYVENMFYGINLTRLRELHIYELDIYFNSLESLLLSVKKSLVILTLKRVTLRSEESTSADDSASQHKKSPNHQENQRFTPLMPTYTPSSPYTPGSPGFVPTPPDVHPTSPSIAIIFTNVAIISTIIFTNVATISTSIAIHSTNTAIIYANIAMAHTSSTSSRTRTTRKRSPIPTTFLGFLVI
ncbi:hypothetical protein N7504_002524 [Penicillium tannophilum]|nr:hypothetical protein N7504_002524 [Penicillium tannophilum]